MSSERRGAGDRRRRYDAFNSYGKSADAELAVAIRDGLRRLGRPRNRRRSGD